jgi:Mrp family chromosome partitioning ATPase
MIDKETILQNLKQVLDPEIGINIVELNMVRDITIQDEDNVEITIALTVAHCPMAKTLETDVQTILKKTGQVKTVKVKTTAMSRQELNDLRIRLQNRVQPISSQSSLSTKTGINPGIERLGKRGIRNIIAIVSGKGGVGKSFVSGMLACELRRQGYEVGVLDADLTGPSIAKIFGLTEKPSKNSNGMITPIHTKTGIKVMSINLILEDPSMPVIWRGPIVNSVIRQLYWDVDWGDLHYLIVDLPPGTSDAPLTVFQSLPVDGVIVVSSPQDLAAMIVTKAVKMAAKMNAPILGLIENMSHLECPNCGHSINVFGRSKGEQFAGDLGITYLAGIPLDPEIAMLSDNGKLEEYRSPAFASIANELRLKTTKQVEQLSQGLPIAWTA